MEYFKRILIPHDLKCLSYYKNPRLQYSKLKTGSNIREDSFINKDYLCLSHANTYPNKKMKSLSNFIQKKVDQVAKDLKKLLKYLTLMLLNLENGSLIKEKNPNSKFINKKIQIKNSH